MGPSTIVKAQNISPARKGGIHEGGFFISEEIRHKLIREEITNCRHLFIMEVAGRFRLYR